MTFVLLFMLVSDRDAAPSPRPPIRCGAPAVRDLHIHLIDRAGVVPRTLDDAKDEVTRIWTRAGLRLIWTVPPTSVDTADAGTVVIIVRRRLSRHSGVRPDGARGATDPALGWVLFDGEDHRGLVEVSIDAITAVVMDGVFGSTSVLTLPGRTQKDLLGRGLGRVIAHEIGHWCMGREHMHGGLMKASLNPQDLIEWAAPPLPHRWTAGECQARP